MINKKYLDLNSDALVKSPSYIEGQPFPHIIIDDFFEENILNKILEDFPNDIKKEGENYDNKAEKKLTLGIFSMGVATGGSPAQGIYPFNPSGAHFFIASIAFFRPVLLDKSALTSPSDKSIVKTSCPSDISKSRNAKPIPLAPPVMANFDIT